MDKEIYPAIEVRANLGKQYSETKSYKLKKVQSSFIKKGTIG